MVFTLKIEDRIIQEIKKRWRDKAPIGTMHSVNPSHSSTLLRRFPFIKDGSSAYPKLMEMG